MRQTPAHITYNETLLAACPTGIKRVVEFGCSTGRFAEAYRALSPESFYVGIDIAEEYTIKAKQHCSETHCLDVEGLSGSDLQLLDGDLYILGDILEHLIDPWLLLLKLQRASKKGTKLAVCVPNMQHWSVQKRLITGELFYEIAGLLDKTHLRWFTEQTLVQLLTVTGWSIVEARARVFDEPGREEYLTELVGVAEKLGWDKERILQNSAVYQFVVLCEKEQ